MRRRTNGLASIAILAALGVTWIGCANQNPCGPYQGYPAYPYGQPAPVYPVNPNNQPVGTVPPGYGQPIGAPGVAGYPVAPNGGVQPGYYPYNNNGAQPILGR